MTEAASITEAASLSEAPSVTEAPSLTEALSLSEALDVEPGNRFELNPLFLFRWEDTQDSYVLLYPEGVVKLNQTAGEILKRCDGAHTVAALIDELKHVFNEPPERVDNGVRKFLEVSYAKGWIRTRA